MSRLTKLLAGALLGTVVGIAASLVFPPDAEVGVREQLARRWQMALEEARDAMEETQKELEREFDRLKAG